MNVPRRLSGVDDRIRTLYNDRGLARQAPERGSGSCKSGEEPKGGGVDVVEMHFARMRWRYLIKSNRLILEES